MYSVDDIIEQIDQISDTEDNLEGTEENEDGTEDANNENKDESDGTKVQPKVKRKQAPRPKLDAERLKGPRGLICMEKMFSDLKFKGHGHEKQDLNQTMNMLQYWCHRLFPKFTFDDCLAHLEKLGTKKPVITLKKKILFDMIEEDTIQPDPDNLPVDVDDVTDSQQEAIDVFDKLLNEEPIPTSISTTQPAVTAEVELTEEQKEMIERNRLLAAERRRARLEALKQKEIEDSEKQSQEASAQNLTEEQKSIIEKNRLLAIEKRKNLQNKTKFLSSQDSAILSETAEDREVETIDGTNMEVDISSSEKNRREFDAGSSQNSEHRALQIIDGRKTQENYELKSDDVRIEMDVNLPSTSSLEEIREEFDMGSSQNLVILSKTVEIIDSKNTQENDELRSDENIGSEMDVDIPFSSSSEKNITEFNVNSQNLEILSKATDNTEDSKEIDKRSNENASEDILGSSSTEINLSLNKNLINEKENLNKDETEMDVEIPSTFINLSSGSSSKSN